MQTILQSKDNPFPQEKSGARMLVKALAQQGIQFVFGIPGTHNIELYDELNNEASLSPILVTDEQSAGFMADGVFRASGRMAAINLVPGAGLTHALSGIAEAFYDQIPMLVIMTAPRRDLTFGYQLHDIDQAQLVKPVVKEVLSIKSQQEIWNSVRYAHALALQAPRGPVALEIPAELYLKTETPVHHHAYPEPPVTPLEFSQLDYQNLKGHLARKGKIGLYLGLGAAMPSVLLERLADRLDALVFTSVSAKGIFPEHHPRFVWNGMGPALPSALRSFEKDLDCVLAIGCRFSEVATASYGFSFRGTLLHVDIDRRVFHRNYPAAAVLQADAASFVRRLLAEVEVGPAAVDEDRLPLLAAAQEEVRAEQAAAESPHAVNPHRLMRDLQRVFGEEALFVTDSGNGLFHAMESLRLDHPHSFLAPVDFSCMGYSIPAAIGAKFASPARPVIALVGDGAMLMTGLEMLTAQIHRLGILFIILADGKLSQIAQFQQRALGRQVAVDLPSIKFEALAQSLDLRYMACSQNEELGDVLLQAGACCEQGQPVLLVVSVDSSVTTYFTRAVIKTNFERLDWSNRWLLLSRRVKREILQ